MMMPVPDNGHFVRSSLTAAECNSAGRIDLESVFQVRWLTE